jgi:adenosine deaminase
MHLHDAPRAMPKVSLHCHLEGSIQARAVVDLAAKHGLTLPEYHEPEDLHDCPVIYQFLRMYETAAHSVRDFDDFQRVGSTMADFRRFVMNGIDGCWIDEGTRAEWKRGWGAEIDALAAQVD